MKRIILPMIAMICSLLACKKSDIDPPVKTLMKPLITAAGVNSGTSVSATISANGGTITSSDGRISVAVPAGALSSAREITIQPITNTVSFGIGKAYRLTPHDIQFNVPATITFHYTDADLAGTSEKVLSIGFQDADGKWQSMNDSHVNSATKELSVTTTHFSDWGFFPLLYITPMEAQVNPGEQLPLKIMIAFDSDLLFDLPLPGSIIPLSEPTQLLGSYIKKWMYGGAGSLNANGSSATYQAPANPPVLNPEAVSAEILMERKGTFILVSNITVLSEFHIDYLQVDETEVHLQNPPIDYPSRLFIYGNFGTDPGPGNRSVTINGSTVEVATWSPKVLICEISAAGPTSSGEVLVRSGNLSASKLLNEWTVEMVYAKKESPDGSLTRKTSFIMRFRGDAVGYGSGETPPLFEYTNLNKMSKAVIEMPAGTFSNSVSQSTCGTFTVKWNAIPQVVYDRVLNSSGDGFSGRVYQSPSGFGVMIKFDSDNILTSTRIFSPCVGSVTQQIVQEPITFEGYHNEVIHFNFQHATSRTPIAGGNPPILVGTGVAPGLFYDAIDVNPQLFDTRISWQETQPKFD